MGADFFCLLECRRFSRADCPDRLIGDHEFCNILRSKSRECRLNLIRHIGEIGACLSDRKRLAAADDGRNTRRICRMGTLIDPLVRLAEVVTALTVPKHAVGDADLRQHLG